jgi:hypothetical protein
MLHGNPLFIPLLARLTPIIKTPWPPNPEKIVLTIMGPSAVFFAAAILSLKTPGGNSLLITSSIHLQELTESFSSWSGRAKEFQ